MVAVCVDGGFLDRRGERRHSAEGRDEALVRRILGLFLGLVEWFGVITRTIDWE